MRVPAQLCEPVLLTRLEYLRVWELAPVQPRLPEPRLVRVLRRVRALVLLVRGQPFPLLAQMRTPESTGLRLHQNRPGRALRPLQRFRLPVPGSPAAHPQLVMALQYQLCRSKPQG